MGPALQLNECYKMKVGWHLVCLSEIVLLLTSAHMGI